MYPHVCKPDATGAATLNATVVGAALIALSLPRGPIREPYGGWNRYLV